MDLTGSLVKLRAPRPEDAEAMVAALADPELVLTLDQWSWAPYGRADAEEWVRHRDPASVNWAIECIEDGAFIGATALRDLNFRDRHCDWGIWVGPPSRWNHGYGSEACRLATTFAFKQMGMEKVYLRVYENNPRGRRAYEKAGYRVEGTLLRHKWQHGEFLTAYLMAAHRDDPIYA